jgi:antitoxin component YwqK of YwqJK toxin-antitoxin module
MEGDFKDGRLFDGRLYIYDEDGLLLKVEVYKDGKYHSDGQL